MATNTIVLIVIVAMAGLVLAGAAVAVKYKTRTLGRDDHTYTFRDRADAVELRAVYEKAIAEDDPATAYAAEAEAELTDTQLHGPRAQPPA
jgi:hypothetical protein